jgi:hypothetical protein
LPTNFLIDAPTSGINDGSSIINWVAFNNSAPNGSTQGKSSRLSYPTTYRMICRYPYFSVDGDVKLATWTNINKVNSTSYGGQGDIYRVFGSGVGYDLTRDTAGRKLSASYNPYSNAAMIFDIVAESVADGFNQQLQTIIDYEGKPEPPYEISAISAHLGIGINIRFNRFSKISGEVW